MPGTLGLASTQLRRDLRSGELTLIIAALVVSVAAMTAVSFFIDRIHQSIARQGSSLLAADLAIESPNPIADSLEAAARAHRLATARTLALRSVVAHAQRMQLTELKAVGAGYPLRGTLSVSDVPFGPTTATRAIPAPGTAWVEARLLPALNVTVGASVTVGSTELKVDKVLAVEPDRGGDFFNIAPRLLMNLADIPATRLLLPGSRVSHRLLLAGGDRDLAAFRAQVQPGRGEKLLSVRDARPELRAALDRAHHFLGLASLVAVILAGVAIALSAQRYAGRHLDAYAIMRCLGATQRRIVQVLAIEMLAVGVIASLAGCLIGYAAQSALASILGGLTAGDLPPPSAPATLAGVATGFVILFGFGLAPLLQLKHVPPLRVLRRDLTPVRAPGVLIYAAAAAAIALLTPWQAGDVRLTACVLGGSVATMVVLGMAAWGLVQLLGRLRRHVGIGWRYGLASIARRARSSALQIVALGLGIMVMLLITLVRDDLLAGWQAQIPPGAPNQFLINIAPDEVEPLRQFLHEHGLRTAGIYPMVRGRLVRINGNPVHPENYTEARAQRLTDREFNLSWAATLPADNTIRAGRWWQAGDSASQFSVETGIAETLGLKPGDQLTYQIADRNVSGTITSLRAVQWDTFNANFFVVAPPGMLDTFPVTSITSFHLDDQNRGLLNDLLRRFPNVTIIDVAALMDQVHAIIDRVAAAVQYVFAFTVIAGLLVLIAAIHATHDERMRESAMLKTLGASRAIVARGLTAEFMTLGLCAGLLAAGAAALTGWWLAREIFRIVYIFNPWIWPIGLAAGAAGVTLGGLLGVRRALDQPPAAVLRRLA